MIVYQGTCSSFHTDVINGVIGKKIDSIFCELGIRKEQHAELVSWNNSLPRMSLLLQCNDIPQDAEVAIEFQIPLTSKRVDFMIAGNDGFNDNVVVVELKQWEKCEVTDFENVVNTYTGGADRDVVHPSLQAYSYAKLIQNLNEEVQNRQIQMLPCAYLHNYQEKFRDKLCDARYKEIIKLSPIFLMEDGLKLRNYVSKYIKKPPIKHLFEIIDNGKIKPSKELQTVAGSILNGNKEFELLDEQVVAYSTILRLFECSMKTDDKYTIIVQGGPGTGKSVIAINLLAKLLNNGYSCEYVSKNSAPRNAFSSSVVRGKHKASYLKSLFKGSGCFVDLTPNTFDCLITDEAHRLNLKSGLFSNIGENQIKEIINASKVSVFFIDEDQMISVKDIGTIKEIKKQAKILNSKVFCNDSLILSSQFRCNGSDGYLAFLNDILGIRNSANYDYFDIDYEIVVFDNPCLMREKLRERNINNKARMIAGYCYPWNSKNNKELFDIFLDHDFKAQWNFSTDKFAIDKNSFEQVGCIHSTQGLEFEYVGIIIGNDLRFENNMVITDKSKRAKSDATIRGLKENEELGDKIIRNTYKTLLSRGQKGCYVYCEDKKLGVYLNDRIKAAKEKMRKL